ncbi:GNAT family N-acetyltransferase [uncultured Clostridium sp.]|uniref:GNAT family N-acetyltransferase n=1 Tax=uncultured Clostridium sp. TaxID=59620 RepID=UPI0028F0F80D|nr:GNAT family N-acetyltransferase [uncultured Clostridium sp.]
MGSKSIRNAQKKDVNEVAELIYSTENDQEHVWGGKSKKDNIKIIKKLVEMSDSRYSLNYTKVMEYNGEVAGIIITIPYEDFNKLNVRTEKIILKSLKGFVKKIRFLIEDVKYNLVGECNKGDLYVANIATNEKVRGLGFGKALMNYAERLAKENHCERCVLIAKDEETSEFYEKIKYKKVFNRNILGERIIKMAKPII